MDAETKAEFRVIREEMKRHDERAQETNRLIKNFLAENKEQRHKDAVFHFGEDGRGGINGLVMAHQRAIKEMEDARHEAQKKRDWVLGIVSGVTVIVAGALVLQVLGIAA